MRKPPCSTEEQKLAFVRANEQKFRTVGQDTWPALSLQLAYEARCAGLYSKKTALIDIALGLRKRAEREGYRYPKRI